MKKQLLKRGMAAFFAMALAVGTVAVWPSAGRIAEASATSFDQDIIVVNKTNPDDIAGIRVPDMIFSYQLVPNVNTATEKMDNRYIRDTDTYPKRTTDKVSADTPSIMLQNHLVQSYTSETGTDKIPVEIADFFWDDGSQVSFTESGIYRYELKLVGIYTDNAAISGFGTGDAGQKYKPISTWGNGAVNMIDGGSLIEKPGKTALLCDVAVDPNHNITAIGVWNLEGTDKVTGFSGAADGGIQYNVYNVEVSSDYVYNPEDPNQQKEIKAGTATSNIEYTISFENLPDYLVKQGTVGGSPLTNYDVSSRNLYTLSNNTYTKETAINLNSTQTFYSAPSRGTPASSPKDEGFVETSNDGATYTATTDTTVTEGKKYYKFSDTTLLTADVKGSISPKAEGWVVENPAASNIYEVTEDTSIQGDGSTYKLYSGGENYLKLVMDPGTEGLTGNSAMKSTSVIGQLTVFKGKMSVNGTVCFVGLPYDDQHLLKYTTVPTDVVEFGTALNYVGLNDSRYDTTIFSGSNLERISNITSFTGFKDAGYASKYTLKGNTNGISTIENKKITTGISETDNNARYVLFNPDDEDLVVVGVVLNYAPGIAMIGAAVLALGFMFRRRRLGR